MKRKRGLLALMLSVVLVSGSIGMTAYAAISPSSGGSTTTRTRRDRTERTTVEIENEDVPLGNIPNEDIPEEDIFDEDVPLVNLEDEDVPLGNIPKEDIPQFEISDEDVPLVGLPKTGDSSRSGLWLMLFAGSGAGIVALEAWNRKVRRQADEEA